MSIGVAYLILGDPIGELLVWELLAGLLMVPAAGVLGTALARWLPHPIVAPVALAGLGVVQVLASPGNQVFEGFSRSAPNVTFHFEWLAPWMPPSTFFPPDVIAARPASAHALYLVLFAVVLVYLTLEQGRRGRLAQLGAGVVFLTVLISVSFALACRNLSIGWFGLAAPDDVKLDFESEPCP